MFRLTIIIPALGRQQDLDDTLVSVLENRPANCEILVPHAPSYRDPYDLSDEVSFIPVPSTGLVELINAGIDASQASLVHILTSGIEVTPDWIDAALEPFAAEVALAAVAPRMVSRPGHATQEIRGIRYLPGGAKQYVLADANGEAEAESAAVIEGPSLQAAFYRRSALLSIGRFDVPLGEHYCDVDALVKLRRSGWSCGYAPESLVRGQIPDAPRGFQAGRRVERLFCRHATALGTVRSVLRHSLVVGQTFARQSPHPAAVTSLSGHLYGLIECLALRRHHWHPQALEAATSDPPASQSPPPATIPLENARRQLQDRPRNRSSRRAKRRLG